MIGLSFVGFALFAYFQRTPLPPEFATDKLVPYFMSLAFPAGAVGLVIAAIMAASLSSIDSAINSCTSVAVVDLYNRVWQRHARCARSRRTVEGDRAQVRVSRIATRDLWRRSAPCSPATCRASDRCSRSTPRSSMRSPVRCSASSCWRCSAAAPAAPSALVAGVAGAVHRVLRGVPQRHRLHVAVDVRTGGHARRAAWLLAIVWPSDRRRSLAVTLTWWTVMERAERGMTRSRMTHRRCVALSRSSTASSTS